MSPVVASREYLVNMRPLNAILPALTGTDLVPGRDLPERAEVLITETFASGLLGEGIFPTLEHAHQHLLDPERAQRPQELLDPVCRQDNIHVLRHAADEPVAPDSPAPRQHRGTLQERQQVIDRLHHAAVPARQVLRSKHGRPSDEELIGKLQTLGQRFQADGTHRSP